MDWGPCAGTVIYVHTPAAAVNSATVAGGTQPPSQPHPEVKGIGGGAYPDSSRYGNGKDKGRFARCETVSPVMVPGEPAGFWHTQGHQGSSADGPGNSESVRGVPLPFGLTKQPTKAELWDKCSSTSTEACVNAFDSINTDCCQGESTLLAQLGDDTQSFAGWRTSSFAPTSAVSTRATGSQSASHMNLISGQTIEPAHYQPGPTLVRGEAASDVRGRSIFTLPFTSAESAQSQLPPQLPVLPTTTTSYPASPNGIGTPSSASATTEQPHQPSWAKVPFELHPTVHRQVPCDHRVPSVSPMNSAPGLTNACASAVCQPQAAYVEDDSTGEDLG